MKTLDVASYGICRFVGEVIVANMANKGCSVGTTIDVRRKQYVILPSGSWHYFCWKELLKGEISLLWGILIVDCQMTESCLG